MFDRKIFEQLKKLGEWKELGDKFKELYAEMPIADIEDITQEDMDKIVCEEAWEYAITLTSKLVYEKLQMDLDAQYGKGPVADLKEAMARTLH